MATRDEVYHAINTEREYQDEKWGPAGMQHELGSYIVYMETYLASVKALLTTATTDYIRKKTLEELRKVVALGFAAMEVHGAISRRLVRLPELIESETQK